MSLYISFFFSHFSLFLCCSILLGEVVHDPLGGDGLWSLERHAQGAVPQELRESTHSTTHTEQDSEVLVLGEVVVPQEHATVTVHVRVWVGSLAVFQQDAWHDGVDGVYNLEELVIWKMLQSEIALKHICIQVSLRTEH